MPIAKAGSTILSPIWASTAPATSPFPTTFPLTRRSRRVIFLRFGSARFRRIGTLVRGRRRHPRGAQIPARRYRVGPGAVRCWPHHFDIATLLSLGRGDPEGAAAIGIGMSPGDAYYPQPHFYISPWPAPPADALPRPPIPGQLAHPGLRSGGGDRRGGCSPYRSHAPARTGLLTQPSPSRAGCLPPEEYQTGSSMRPPGAFRHRAGSFNSRGRLLVMPAS
jgi:hypothetical protein